MADYRIKVNISIEPVNANDGEPGTSTTVEEIIDKGVAWSIDDCEDAVVKMGFEAMREELSAHMENISKRGPKKSETGKF